MAGKENSERSNQSERFKRTAREHGVELDEKKLAETLRQMANQEKDKAKPNENDRKH